MKTDMQSASHSRDPEVGTGRRERNLSAMTPPKSVEDQTRDNRDQAKDRHAYLRALMAITQIRRHPKAQPPTTKVINVIAMQLMR